MSKKLTSQKSDIKKINITKFSIFGRGKSIPTLYYIISIITILTTLAIIAEFIINYEAIHLASVVTQVFLCFLTLAVINIPLYFEKKLKLYIPTPLIIMLFIMFFTNTILGEIYRWYDHIMLLDTALHTMGGVVIGLASFSIVTALNNGPSKNKLSPLFIVIFTFCFALTAEYLWEVFEYTMDSFFADLNMQRWKDSVIGEIPPGTTNKTEGEFLHNLAGSHGLNDTMKDMIVNIFGTLGVCIYGYINLKVSPNWLVERVIMPMDEFAEIATKLEKSKNETQENVANVGENKKKANAKKTENLKK